MLPHYPQQHDSSHVKEIKTYRVGILSKDSKLMICVQSDRDWLYILSNYHYNILSRLLMRDEDARRDRFPVAKVHIFTFTATDNGGSISLERCPNSA